MKEVKNKSVKKEKPPAKDLRSKGYKLTKLGRIPTGWEIVKLGSCFKLSSGNTKPKDISEIQTSNYPYPVYGGNDIMGFSKEYFIDGSIILIGRVGEYCGITKLVSGKTWITDNALYTSELLKTFDIVFLTFKLQYENLSRLRNKGGQPLVSQKPIYSKSITLPPLPEQQKIARILSTWDKAIEKTEQLIAQKQQLKKGLMQQLLTGKMRFKEFVTSKKMKKTKLGMIPEDWEILPLEKIATKIMVGIASAATHAYQSTGVIMLRNLNIKEDGIDSTDILYINKEFEKAHRNKRLREGDLITVRTGYPGLSAVVGREFEGAQCFTSLITRPISSVIDSHFLCYFINSPTGKSLMLASEAGGAQKNINAGVLTHVLCPIPTIKEQQKVKSVLSECEHELKLYSKVLGEMNNEKKGLMLKLLTGDVRVKV